MGETSGQIMREIDSERYALDQNLKELQARAAEATDWRYQVRKRPMAVLGAAVVSGVVLGALTAPSRLRSRRSRIPSQPLISGGKRARLSEMMDNLTEAMIGVGTSKVKDFLGQYVPGFREHYDKAERESKASSRTIAA